MPLSGSVAHRAGQPAEPGAARMAARRSPRAALRGLVPPAAVLVASALLFLTALTWATLTPGTRAPDEMQHVNSIVRLLDGGGWPEVGDARVEQRLLQVRELAGATRGGVRTMLPGAPDAVPGAPEFVEITPTPPDARASLAALASTARTGEIDQMTQHPPVYYAAGAVLVRALGGEDWRYDRLIFVLRALTALTLASTVPLGTYLVVRDVSGREELARVASFLPLAIPQLGFLGGTVTNDGVTIAVTSLLTAALVRLVSAGPTVRRSAAVAVLAGIACLTKGTALGLVLLVPVAVLVGYRRQGGTVGEPWAPRALRALGWVLGAAFLVGGWWWALNLLRYGALQPNAGVTPQGAVPPLGIVDYLAVFQPRVDASYFGDIGLLEAPFPAAFTQTMAAGFLVLAVLGSLRRPGRPERVLLALAVAVTYVSMVATTYSAHLRTENLPGLQGRYLFVALVPTLALVALGADVVLGWARSRWLHAQWVLVPGALGIAGYGLARGFDTYYRGAQDTLGGAIDRFLGWAPWSLPVLGALLAGGVGLLLATGWALARSVPGRAPAS